MYIYTCICTHVYTYIEFHCAWRPASATREPYAGAPPPPANFWGGENFVKGFGRTGQHSPRRRFLRTMKRHALDLILLEKVRFGPGARP